MYKRTRQGWQKHSDFILLDILCGQIALALAYSLRFKAYKLVYSEEIYRSLAVWIFLSLILLGVYGTYGIVAYQRWKWISVWAQCMALPFAFALLYKYLMG